MKPTKKEIEKLAKFLKSSFDEHLRLTNQERHGRTLSWENLDEERRDDYRAGAAALLAKFILTPRPDAAKS